MILPGSTLFSLILLALSLLLVGSWANTFKWTGGKWRYELYYFDFAIGTFLAALIVGLTLGSFGFDGFSFGDDFSATRNSMRRPSGLRNQSPFDSKPGRGSSRGT